MVSDVYAMQSSKEFVNTLEDNIRFTGATSKLISDYAQVGISNKMKAILSMYQSSSWPSEPYHQNQNSSEWRYRTIKASTNTILDRTGAPANYCLLCLSYVCDLLNPMSCESLNGQIPLTKLFGVTPNISIIMMHTFYKSVYYASHNQFFHPPVKRNMHFGLALVNMQAMIHKLADSSSQNIIYRSAVCPADDVHPNKCLLTDLVEPVGSNKPKPITLLNPIRIKKNL